MFAPDQIQNGFDNSLSGEELTMVSSSLSVMPMLKRALEKKPVTIEDCADTFVSFKSGKFTFGLSSYGKTKVVSMTLPDFRHTPDMAIVDAQKYLLAFIKTWPLATVTFEDNRFSARTTLIVNTEDGLPEAIFEAGRLLVATSKAFIEDIEKTDSLGK